VSGELIVWKGPLKKQDGSLAANGGKAMSLPEVETMNYLVQGVIGTAS
jgi:hypothetical protein